jgi:hypothetical protein
VANYRLNKLAKALTTAQPCPIVNASGTLTTEAVQGDGWCRVQTENLNDGASFSYRISNRQPATVNGQSVWQRKIVSTGTVNGVVRRAVSTANAPAASPLFQYGVFSHLDLNMSNSAEITADVGSNGNVNMNNSASICGDITVAPGKTVNGSASCGGTISTAPTPLTLEPVVLPATNDNGRLSSGADPKTAGISWNATTRVLVGDGGTVTLRGTDYVFCSIHLTNGALIVVENDGTPVNIYIDDPANCTTGDPARGSVHFEKKGRIDTLGPASLARVYMVGSTSIATSLVVDHNEKVGVEMLLYAPNSTFSISNNGQVIGAVVAKQVTMQNSSEITYDPNAASVMGPEPTQIYARQAWVECKTTTSGSSPDSGC